MRRFGVPTRTMAAAVVNRFPPDPAEPRLGKQLLLLCRRCYCFGAGGLATTQSSVTWLFDHDPANECLVTGLFRIALVQRSKNTVRCCDLWPVLVFLTEARGILRLRLTITYHEGRGSAWRTLRWACLYLFAEVDGFWPRVTVGAGFESCVPAMPRQDNCPPI